MCKTEEEKKRTREEERATRRRGGEKREKTRDDREEKKRKNSRLLFGSKSKWLEKKITVCLSNHYIITRVFLQFRAEPYLYLYCPNT